MTILGLLFFASVLVASVWSIVATVTPRLAYITALLSHSVAAPVLVPVAQRRRVRRFSAPSKFGSPRSPLTLRAAA